LKQSGVTCLIQMLTSMPETGRTNFENDEIKMRADSQRIWYDSDRLVNV